MAEVGVKSSLLDNQKSFIAAWQLSSDLEEVASKTNLTVNTVVSKAATFRTKYGVSLKKLGKRKTAGGRQRVNVSELQSYLNSLGSSSESSQTTSTTTE